MAIKDYLATGKAWEDKSYFQNYLRVLMRGYQRKMFNDKCDLDQEYKIEGDLLSKIKDSEYIDRDMINKLDFDKSFPIEKEISVHIDRDGQYILCGGCYTLL